MTLSPDAAARRHAMDDALALQWQGDGCFLGHTSAAYANMVGPFGGVTAAMILQAPLLHPQRLGDPVALTLNFAGPVEDGPFIISARPVRTNRSTQHWVIELRQGDLVAVTATAFFATRRDTWADTEARFPSVPAPEEVARMAPISWAAWTHNYDMRVVRGGLDQMATQGPGLEESLTQLWIRDEPPRALDFPALAAICDAFFPRLFLRRPKMVAVGTVSLTIYFHADADSLALHGDPAVLGIARGLNFRRGYFDQAAEIWSRDGTMLASSHQVVYYKE